MDARAQITMDGLLRTADDRFAIFAEPPGLRDLGALEHWEHSLARSHRRRRAAAARLIALPKAATARISAALIAAGIVSQAGPMIGAAQAAQTTHLDLRSGARGARVAAAQSALGLAADGVFGPQTKRAVRAFQRAHGLTVDGRIGPMTFAALGLGHSATRTAHKADVDPSTSTTTKGPAPSPGVTRAVQSALGLAADGVYGPQTRAAVVAYQRSHALTVDGIVGPQTLSALGVSGPATSAATSAPATESAATTTTSSAGSGVQAAVAAAMSKVGSPYVSGATGPSSFDCSGLTSWAMRQAGIAIPRTSFAQFGSGSSVSQGAIQAGDLVFFDTAGPGASDVGLATGPTTAVSATTHGVMTHAILSGYWGEHFVGARRVG
jgi:peptidoglycan DL-endopeptidase CwlO